MNNIPEVKEKCKLNIDPFELDFLTDQELYNFVKTEMDRFFNQKEIYHGYFLDIDEIPPFQEVKAKVIVKVFDSRNNMIYYRKIIKDSIIIDKEV